MSLKQQAKAGFFWTFLQQFGTQIISFIVSIYLARLLQPSDFGTIAMFAILLGIASTLAESGLTASLIRSDNVDERDLSTVFWFNLGVSCLLYVLIFFAAPLVALFFEVDILTPIIRVYCLILIIQAFASVQRTRFIKDMDFRTSFKIQLPSLIIGGICGVLMAYNGFGIWTLVYYPIIQISLSTIQFWLYSRWRPSFLFDMKKFKYHFNFGSRMALSGLLDIGFQNIYTIIIGKFYSPAQLGFYNRADSLKQLPVSNLSAALNNVTFPLFSKIKDNDLKLRETYRKLMKVVIFVIAPVLCLMMVVAEPLIRFLLTDKWLPAVPFLQILAIAGILYPVHAYNLNVLKVKGRSDLFLMLEVIKKTIMVVVVLVSLQFGLMGLVWGQVVFSVLAFFVNTHYTGKILNYGAFRQALDLMPTLFVTGLVAFVFYTIDEMFLKTSGDVLRLFALSAGYLIVFLLVTKLLKFSELQDIKDLLKK